MFIRATFIELSASDFATAKISADSEDKTYKIGGEGDVKTGTPTYAWQSVLKLDNDKVYTHGHMFDSMSALAFTNYIYPTVTSLDNLEGEDGAIVEYCGVTNEDWENGAYYIFSTNEGGSGIGGGISSGKRGWGKLSRNNRPNNPKPDQPGSGDSGNDQPSTGDKFFSEYGFVVEDYSSTLPYINVTMPVVYRMSGDSTEFIGVSKVFRYNGEDLLFYACYTNPQMGSDPGAVEWVHCVDNPTYFDDVFNGTLSSDEGYDGTKYVYRWTNGSPEFDESRVREYYSGSHYIYKQSDEPKTQPVYRADAEYLGLTEKKTEPEPETPDPTNSWTPTKWDFEVEGHDYYGEEYGPYGLYNYTYMAVAKDNPMGIPSGVYVFYKYDDELNSSDNAIDDLYKYVDESGSIYFTPSITVGKTSIVDDSGRSYKIVGEEYNEEESRTEYILNDGSRIHNEDVYAYVTSEMYAELGSSGSFYSSDGIKCYKCDDRYLGIIANIDGAESIIPFNIGSGNPLGDWMEIGSIGSLEDTEEVWDEESNPDHWGIPNYVRFSISVELPRYIDLTGYKFADSYFQSQMTDPIFHEMKSEPRFGVLIQDKSEYEETPDSDEYSYSRNIKSNQIAYSMKVTEDGDKWPTSYTFGLMTAGGEYIYGDSFNSLPVSGGAHYITAITVEDGEGYSPIYRLKQGWPSGGIQYFSNSQAGGRRFKNSQGMCIALLGTTSDIEIKYQGEDIWRNTWVESKELPVDYSQLAVSK